MEGIGGMLSEVSSRRRLLPVSGVDAAGDASAGGIGATAGADAMEGGAPFIDVDGFRLAAGFAFGACFVLGDFGVWGELIT